MNNGTFTKIDIGNDEKESSKMLAITGSSSQGSFVSATRRTLLHLSRAGILVRGEDVVDHLKKTFPLSEFQVQILPKREKSNSVSFKIGA